LQIAKNPLDWFKKCYLHTHTVVLLWHMPPSTIFDNPGLCPPDKDEVRNPHFKWQKRWWCSAECNYSL